MPRKVKCQITGEFGTSDEFVKINGHYYKSQAVYDAAQRKKESYKTLVDYICREFLGYGNGQPFPPSLPKKLKELEFYDSEVILETFKQCASEIHYWLERKQFQNEYGKIAYMFTIVKGRIADVYESYLWNQQQQRLAHTILETDELFALGTREQGKNISRFLDAEDI